MRWGDTDESEGDHGGNGASSELSAPLESKWTFWFHEGGSKGQSSIEFENHMKNLGVISTVQDFWRHWNNIVIVNKLPEHSNTQLFKEGIKPTWEDQSNIEGGRWTLLCSTKEETNDLALKASLAVIGEQLEFGDDVCGLVVSIRPNGDTINVWNRNCKDQKVISATTAQLQKILGRQNIRYQSHREAMQNNHKKQHRRNSSHCADPLSPRTKAPPTPGRSNSSRTTPRDGDEASAQQPKSPSPKFTQTTPPASQSVSRSTSSISLLSNSSSGLPPTSLNNSEEIPAPGKSWMDNPRIASWADEVEDEERMLGISSKSMPNSPAIHPPQLSAREPGATRHRQPYQRHVKSRSLQTDSSSYLSHSSSSSSNYSHNHTSAHNFTSSPQPHAQHHPLDPPVIQAPPTPTTQALLATPTTFSGTPPSPNLQGAPRRKPDPAPGSPPLAASSPAFHKQHRKSASVSVVETDSANALERRKNRGSPSQSPVLSSLNSTSRWNGRSSLPSTGKIIPAMLDIPSFTQRHKRAGSVSDKRRPSPAPSSAGLTDEEEFPDMIIHSTDEEARLASLQPGVFQQVHRRQTSKSHVRIPSGDRKTEVRKAKSSQVSTIKLVLQHLPFLLMILALYLISSRTQPIDVASLRL